MTELRRDGPGLLLRDIARGEDRDVLAVQATIRAADADILLLLGFDWDAGGEALAAFAVQLRSYPHVFTARPNAGLATDKDLDGDGAIGGPADAQGWGRFTGQGGMAILSRYPIVEEGVIDHSAFLWADLPGATLPQAHDGPFFPADVLAVQRLASVAHWEVPVVVGGAELSIWTMHASPPVFDGPEDRNGLRNRDEIRFWQARADAAEGPFVLMGDSNLDPYDGDGFGAAMATLLAHPGLIDPRPASPAAAAAARAEGGANRGHRGDPALDTVDWRDDPGPGNLRVDYVLPSADLKVIDAGVIWPAAGKDGARAGSRHGLVWVDLEFPAR